MKHLRRSLEIRKSEIRPCFQWMFFINVEISPGDRRWDEEEGRELDSKALHVYATNRRWENERTWRMREK